MGVDSDTEIDHTRPTVAAEITPDQQHMEIDMGPVLGPLVGDPDIALGMEMWIDAERLVIDTSSFAMFDDVAGAQLGPMAPGVAFVDLAALGAESDAVVTALVGRGQPTLAELAADVPPVLRDVERVPGDQLVFEGTATFFDVMTALGSDVEVNAKATAAGVALNLDVDPATLGQVYIDFYEQLETDVSIAITESGLMDSITMTADLAGIFDFMYATDALFPDLTAAERDAASEAFADTEWTMTTMLSFEPDDDLVIADPPATTDDRTDLWHDFLVSSGIVT